MSADLDTLALSPAVSARTVLAAGTWLTWSVDGEPQHAPYFEDDGTPVLVLERRTSEALLRAGTLSTTSYVLPRLGVLRFSGSVWPVAGRAFLAAVQQFRLQHAECEDCCGPLRSHLVGVRLEDVAFAVGGAGVFQPVDLDAFLAATPDPILTRSVQVRAHLNADHHDELRILASRLLGVPEPRVAATTLDWIDAQGVDLTVIGEEGSGTYRFPFRVPLTAMDDLGGRLHQLLNHPGAHPC
jgi:hypothetical protein